MAHLLGLGKNVSQFPFPASGFLAMLGHQSPHRPVRRPSSNEKLPQEARRVDHAQVFHA
jgi:hypothetical protein